MSLGKTSHCSQNRKGQKSINFCGKTKPPTKTSHFFDHLVVVFKVIMWNGLKPFLVEILCRGKVRRVRALPNLGDGDGGYGWEDQDYEEQEEEKEVDEDQDVKFQDLETDIWKRRLDSDEEQMDLGYGTRFADFNTDPVLDLYVQDIFIGRSEVEDFAWRCGISAQFDGNAILLKKDELEYLFIGKDIFGFKTRSEISKFASPMGNSCVPYTFAVDQEGRHFLFLEKVILETIPDLEEDEKKKDGRELFHPYTYLYNLKNDKCKFQLRYGGRMITYKHPSQMFPVPKAPVKHEKIVNGKARVVEAEEFERLLRKWFKTLGISQMHCQQVQLNGEAVLE